MGRAPQKKNSKTGRYARLRQSKGTEIEQGTLKSSDPWTDVGGGRSRPREHSSHRPRPHKLCPLSVTSSNSFPFDPHPCSSPPVSVDLSPLPNVSTTPECSHPSSCTTHPSSLSTSPPSQRARAGTPSRSRRATTGVHQTIPPPHKVPRAQGQQPRLWREDLEERREVVHGVLRGGCRGAARVERERQRPRGRSRPARMWLAVHNVKPAD